MYADPQSIDFDGGSPVTLPRVGIGNGVGTFVDASGLKKAIVRQTTTKSRARHEARMTLDKLSADPLNPTLNVPKSASVYIVVDAPIVGFDAEDLMLMINGLIEWIGAPNMAKLVGGEY